MAIAPSMNTSLLGPGTKPRATAGSMYSGVQRTATESPTIRATPRSPSIGNPIDVNKMFRGRDIPVQHATLMRVGQRGTDRRQRRDHFANGEPAAPREHVGERSPIGEIEHQDGGLRRRNHSVQANQVRVIQGGQQCRLGSRRAQRVRLRQRDPFEGHPLACRSDAGSPHLARVTRSEQLTDHETGEPPCCTAHGHAG